MINLNASLKMKRLLYIAAFLLVLPLAAAAQPSVHVVSGPYLQAVGEREFTVVWTTNIDAVSWVEIAPDDGTHFYNTERPKYDQVLNGRRPIGKLHVVKVTGLEPATTYRYRVMQNGVLLNEGRKRVVFGEGFGSDILRQKPFEVTTLDKSKATVDFSVVNDMHEHDSILRVLYKDVKPGKYDFVCFNGDMTTSIDAESELMDHYLMSSSKLFAANTPLYVARGNHENRGVAAGCWSDFFPAPTGETYYAFRRGPAFFLVLDGCEDKPDSDIEYYGLADYDAYRAEECAWLKRAVQSEEFLSASARIVLLHVPPTTGTWHGNVHLNELFMPVLNEAGVDLMLCGHEHRYSFHPAGERGARFPIVINDNKSYARCDVTDSLIRVRIVGPRGKVAHTHEFPLNGPAVDPQ